MEYMHTLVNRKQVQWFLLLLIFSALLYIRVGDRLINPQVWSEDAGISSNWGETDVLPNLLSYLQFGWFSLFQPMNGYYILVPKIITAISASISIIHYPFVSTLLAWIIILLVLCAIAAAPVSLAGRVLLAVACLLVPSDPEVFGLPLYTFWWLSILLFLLIFWDENSKKWTLRAIYIFFAGLSSPVILAMLPLFWLRAYKIKSRIEIGLACWITICSLLQLMVMRDSGALSAESSNLGVSDAAQIVPKFMGNYIIGNLYSAEILPFGILLSAFLLVALLRNFKTKVAWIFLYILSVSIAMSISRVDIKIIIPALAGQLYFFYPFIRIRWVLIQIALCERSLFMRRCAWLALILCVFNMFPVRSRSHSDLNWYAHVNSCQHFDGYLIPVQTDGVSSHAWQMPLSKNLCEKIHNIEFFSNDEDLPTVPYKVVGTSKDVRAIGKLSNSNSIEKNEWRGYDYYSSNLKMSLAGWRVLGSYKNSDNDAGELVLNVKRGEQVWFRSEPKSNRQRIIVEAGVNRYLDVLPASSEWVLLEFSNNTLPSEFKVRFVDGGGGWGEWSAIALKY